MGLGGTKQNIHRSKRFDESYQKMYFFFKFEPLCLKLWAFISNLQWNSPNMAMSRNPGCKFQKFLFFPSSILNFRKRYEIWGKLAQEPKRLQGKNKTQVGKHPYPCTYRVMTYLVQFTLKFLVQWNQFTVWVDNYAPNLSNSGLVVWSALGYRSEGCKFQPPHGLHFLQQVFFGLRLCSRCTG